MTADSEILVRFKFQRGWVSTVVDAPHLEKIAGHGGTLQESLQSLMNVLALFAILQPPFEGQLKKVQEESGQK